MDGKVIEFPAPRPHSSRAPLWQKLLLRKEKLLKVEKPLLDEQALQEMSIVCFDSLKHELEVIVQYWEDGHFKQLIGVVDRIDAVQKKIKIKNNDEKKWLPIDCLKKIERN